MTRAGCQAAYPGLVGGSVQSCNLGVQGNQHPFRGVRGLSAGGQRGRQKRETQQGNRSAPRPDWAGLGAFARSSWSESLGQDEELGGIR